MIVGNEFVYKAAAMEHKVDLTRLCKAAATEHKLYLTRMCKAQYIVIRNECKPVDNVSTTALVPAGGCCHSGDNSSTVDSR